MNCSGGDDPDDQGARNDGQGLWEGRATCNDGRGILSAFEEKRHVIQDGPENDTVDKCKEVGNIGVLILEYSKREDGMSRNLGFVDDERESEEADDDGDKGVPAEPGMHDAAPGDGHEKGGFGYEENDEADIVDLKKPSFQGAFLTLKFKEGNNAHKTNSHNKYIEIEDPAPGTCLGQGASNERTGYAAYRPDDTDESKVVLSLAEGHHVGDEDFREGNYCLVQNGRQASW